MRSSGWVPGARLQVHTARLARLGERVDLPRAKIDLDTLRQGCSSEKPAARGSLQTSDQRPVTANIFTPFVTRRTAVNGRNCPVWAAGTNPRDQCVSEKSRHGRK
jgi:hypothetical protein